jgi:hypothetical protein
MYNMYHESRYQPYSTHFLKLIESKILETRKIWRPTPNLESVSKKVMSPFPKQIYWVNVTRQQNTHLREALLEALTH